MICRSIGMLWSTLLFIGILIVLTMMLSVAQLLAQTPPVPLPIAVLGQAPAVILHAEGSQVYECETDQRKRLAWQPREPIATLILDGDTVGRHYAGLRWGHVDHSK